MKIHPSFFLFAIIALLSCQSIDGIISFPGVVKNPDDCTNDETICTSKGLVCDRETKACFNGACASNINCALPTATVCSNNTCIPCSGDMDCSAWSTARNKTPRRNFCTSIAQANTCAECRPSMSNADCDPAGMTPTCDAATGSCRPCRADSDCASGICRKPGDYPEGSIGGLMTGQCVPSGMIAYVDKDSVNKPCNDSNSGAQDSPLCTVAKAMSLNRQYIYVAPSTQGNYPALTVSSGSFVIVGPGRDAVPTAKFDSITVNGTGSLVISDINVAANLPLPAAGTSLGAITCTNTGTNYGTIYARRVLITNLSGRGIDAGQGCGKFIVENSRVYDTIGYGIIGGFQGTATTKYRIVNTAVVNCGQSSMEPDNIFLGSMVNSTDQYFAFNTIAHGRNGILCFGTHNLSDSIIIPDSGGTPILQCPSQNQARIVTSGAVLQAGPEPKLMGRVQANIDCCIDKGQMPPATVPPLPMDYYGTDRPQGSGYDIGYHELP